MRAAGATLLLAALSLGGCCLSGGGCDAPLATARAGWDGLGQPPAEGTPSPGPERRVSSRARDQSVRPKSGYDLSKASEEAGAGFPSDDDELKRKLVICHGCGTGGTERVTNRSVSVPRNWESD